MMSNASVVIQTLFAILVFISGLALLFKPTKFAPQSIKNSPTLVRLLGVFINLIGVAILFASVQQFKQGLQNPEQLVSSREISDGGVSLVYRKDNLIPFVNTRQVSSTSKRLYVYFFLRADIESSITYRWLYKHKLMERYSDFLHSGYNFVELQPPDGQRFEIGVHTIEVLMNDGRVLTSLSFEVN